MKSDWFLRKHAGGETFGPLSLAQLLAWASGARVAPHDLLSQDRETWIKAPMLSDLQMDWLVELTSEQCYGPTTVGAIHEFLRLGEITPESFVINTCDGSSRRVAELAQSFPPDGEIPEHDETGGVSPATTGISIKVEDRIRDLEQTLREERSALREADERYRELEERYQQLLATAPRAD